MLCVCVCDRLGAWPAAMFLTPLYLLVVPPVVSSCVLGRLSAWTRHWPRRLRAVLSLSCPAGGLGRRGPICRFLLCYCVAASAFIQIFRPLQVPSACVAVPAMRRVGNFLGWGRRLRPTGVSDVCISFSSACPCRRDSDCTRYGTVSCRCLASHNYNDICAIRICRSLAVFVTPQLLVSMALEEKVRACV